MSRAAPSASGAAAVAAPGTWWGARSIPPGRAGIWRIGPLSLWIRRFEHEWRVAYETGDDPMEDRLEIAAPVDDVEPPETATTRRYVADGLTERIVLMPALLDRAVVVRPELPLDVLPEQEVTLYMSTPVFVRLQTDEREGTLIDEVPSFRLSDTWFGPNTLTGELCYSSRTHARLNFQNVQFRPGRAVTAVRLRNRGRDRLRLERFNLPVPNLHLFRDAAGRLWTEMVTVERQRDRPDVEVRLQPAPPPLAEGAQRLLPPRAPAERNVLVRAFGALLG